MIAIARGLTVDPDLRARLADLYCAYDNLLNDGELELGWPSLFAEACIDKAILRDNIEQGMPIAVIYCKSRDMLTDRMVALRETALFAPRIARRITAAICLRAIEPDGMHLTASFAVFQTMPDQPSELFLCGSCRDRVMDDAGTLRFAERMFICNSTIVPTSLVYPL